MVRNLDLKELCKAFGRSKVDLCSLSQLLWCKFWGRGECWWGGKWGWGLVGSRGEGVFPFGLGDLWWGGSREVCRWV